MVGILNGHLVISSGNIDVIFSHISEKTDEIEVPRKS